MEDSSVRSKTFKSLDSLWYEEERLATFIDWPLKFILPQDLAANGFYYLRSEDHCACAFCRGIVGSWEEGDTPEQEHKRHFPSCPFVRSLPTPNVSINLGRILSKCKGLVDKPSVAAKKEPEKPEQKPIILPVGKTMMSSELSSVGLHLYSGPKKKDFITYETRLDSFKNWPSRVVQKPQELADAGFYYCGVSDHVRCFHCGNGLRNWEADDIPWNEHARWNPECNFVLLTKGIDFVDKVRREKPPYLRTASSQPSTSLANAKLKTLSLTDAELENLLELPVIASVLTMGFDRQIVKKALQKRLKDTGIPFFSTETCLEAILQIEALSQFNRENISMQERKLEGMHGSGQPQTAPTLSVTPTHCNSQNLETSVSGASSTSQATSSSVAPLLPTLPNPLHASPPLRSSTPTSQVEQSSLVSSPPPQTIESEEIQTPSQDDVGEDVVGNQTSSSASDESVSSEITTPSSPQISSSSMQTSPSVSTEASPSTSTLAPPYFTYRQISHNELTTNTNIDPLIEAEHVIEEANKLLGNKTSESEEENPSSNEANLNKTIENDSEQMSVEEETNALGIEADKLAEELEKLREGRMCRVCWDKEMDIVFLPCTHMVTCSSCAVALTVCPICRANIQYAFKPIIT